MTKKNLYFKMHIRLSSPELSKGDILTLISHQGHSIGLMTI